ncbi:MAG: hypothetical protein A2Z77_06725 [Chloroflexi bacterium RBG_13_51_36]|nr:MAG: hypothetical protein A2Z77_06725 [Chloroflexi bacterium RBG_13_51_36]
MIKEQPDGDLRRKELRRPGHNFGNRRSNAKSAMTMLNQNRLTLRETRCSIDSIKQYLGEPDFSSAQAEMARATAPLRSVAEVVASPHMEGLVCPEASNTSEEVMKRGINRSQSFLGALHYEIRR